MVGIFLALEPSDFARFLMDAGAVGLWGILTSINAAMIYTLLKNGFRPALSKDFVDILFYFAVVYLVLEKLSLPWMAVAFASTVLMVAILYLLVTLIRYSRIIDIMVEPVSLHPLALGFRIFSVFIGLLLASLPHSCQLLRIDLSGVI
jgi:hypothetical protein